jgi:cation diffusion facilitator CzcD-associated flavoprotein CzcO
MALGPEYDVAKHFTPRYNPWEQRLCLVPDGDLFKSIRDKRASVVTNEIDTFTKAASSSGMAASSRPTSSSPRPG